MASNSTLQAEKISDTAAARQKLLELYISLESIGVQRPALAQFMKRAVKDEKAKQKELAKYGQLSTRRKSELLEAEVLLSVLG